MRFTIKHDDKIVCETDDEDVAALSFTGLEKSLKKLDPPGQTSATVIDNDAKTFAKMTLEMGEL